MAIGLSLNQDFHWSLLHIFLITLLFFSSCQSGTLMVVNNMKDNPSQNTDCIITPSQNIEAFSKIKRSGTISKRIYEVKQPEYQSYVNHLGEAFDGYNIFQFRDFSNKQYSFRINDMDGNIIDEFPSKNNYGFAQQINSTTFLLISSGPMYFWNIETGKNSSFPFTSHHDISYNPKTKTFMTLISDFIVDVGVDPVNVDDDNLNTYRYDSIREMNMNGEVIWSLNTNSFIPFEWWSGEKIKSNRDITHSNSVFWDIEEDMIYLNCRNLNTFYKIDHSTGQVVWGLGEHGDFTLFDHRGNQLQNLFYHAHALEKVDENTFILFDNDYLNQTDSNNRQSRILEITVNENTMTANISWLWTGTGEYYSAYWGDADRLPNGNRFGVFGSKTHLYTDIGPRLVEVDESGHIVWEMYYKGGSLGIFKAERFRLSPILSSPKNFFTPIGAHIILSWQTWYNFRTKMKKSGSYTLYQEEHLIDSGNVVFDKFWRPTNLAFDINTTLEKGKHNFTLIVADEGGRTTEDKVVAYVGIPVPTTIPPPTTISPPTSNSTVTANSATTANSAAITTASFLLGLGIMTTVRRKKKQL